MGCIDGGAQATDSAHQSAPQGVDRLAEAVKVTLGPKVRMPCSDCLVLLKLAPNCLHLRSLVVGPRHHRLVHVFVSVAFCMLASNDIARVRSLRILS